MTEKKNETKIVELDSVAEELLKECMKEGRIVSKELMSNEEWIIQLVALPPRETNYGGIKVVRRNPAIGVMIRSTTNWKNNITIVKQSDFVKFLEIIKRLMSDEALVKAVYHVIGEKVPLSI